MADKATEAGSDLVSHPRHYAGDGTIECMDAMRSMMGGGYCYVADAKDPKRFRNMSQIAFYWWGCAFKYLWRWPRKGGLRDLMKARRCIDYLVEELGGVGK